MKESLLILFLLSFSLGFAQTKEKIDKEAIKAVMNLQEKAWSNNNLEGFMRGYWKNDSLKFYGSNGLTKGWLKTLENYKKDIQPRRIPEP